MSALTTTIPPGVFSGPALLALAGPPGSGKSTLAAAYAAQLGEQARVLSLDAYRARLSPWGEEADQAATPRAIRALHSDLDRHLAAGRVVIVDATNARAGDRRKLLRIAREQAAVAAAVLVLPPLSVCLERNARRDATVGASGHAPRVPDRVIATMHATLTANWPPEREGWDILTEASSRRTPPSRISPQRADPAPQDPAVGVHTTAPDSSRETAALRVRQEVAATNVEGKRMNTPSPAGKAGTITIGGDLTVNRFGYGAMRLTGPGIWGPPADREAAKNVLRHAVEQGVTFIDTADSYGPDINEELIAEALRPYPDDLVIATKVGLLRTGPSEWHPFARPDYLRQQAETSRRRLGVERIDLWQLHRIDPGTPEHDQFAALKALQDEGVVRHLGLSEIDVDTLDRALEFGLDIATVQNRYNIVVRESESVLERCEQLGIAFIPWFPIAQGILAEPGNSFSDTATRHGVSTAQLSLAWLLHRSPAILPIPGTSSVEHLDENIAAAAITLNDEEFEELDALGRSVAQEFDVPAGA